jgi:hypothetical protein
MSTIDEQAEALLLGAEVIRKEDIVARGMITNFIQNTDPVLLQRIGRAPSYIPSASYIEITFQAYEADNRVYSSAIDEEFIIVKIKRR